MVFCLYAKARNREAKKVLGGSNKLSDSLAIYSKKIEKKWSKDLERLVSCCTFALASPEKRGSALGEKAGRKAIFERFSYFLLDKNVQVKYKTR